MKGLLFYRVRGPDEHKNDEASRTDYQEPEASDLFSKSRLSYVVSPLRYGQLGYRFCEVQEVWEGDSDVLFMLWKDH